MADRIERIAISAVFLTLLAACDGGSVSGERVPRAMEMTQPPAVPSIGTLSTLRADRAGIVSHPALAAGSGSRSTLSQVAPVGALVGEAASGRPSGRPSGDPARTVAGGGAPLKITKAVLDDATVNVPYTVSLSATGGAGGYAWSVAAGALPNGITLGAEGTLTGRPTTVGLFAFTAEVADRARPAHRASKGFNLLVDAGGSITRVALAKSPSPIAVDTGFASFSYEKAVLSTPLFSPSDKPLIALFKKLGPGLLRIGGDSVDDTLFNPAGAGLVPHQVARSDIDRLAGFLKATDWKVLYGIEFLNEQTQPFSLADPTLVAAEAVYAMRSLGSALHAFELGNEPDEYQERIAKLDYASFKSKWIRYREAIVAAVARAVADGTLPAGSMARFSGPAAAYNQPGFIAPFAAALAPDIIELTRHYYRADGLQPGATMALLLAPDPALPGQLSAISTSASANHIAGGYRLAEANSFSHHGAPGVSDAFGSSLWAINFLFDNAWAGSAGVNFHSGDTRPYTPIEDNGSIAVQVRPEYYGIYLYSLAAHGKLVATTVSPTSSTLYAYAVAGAKTTNVVLVNTSDSDSRTVSVHFNGALNSARYVTLYAPSLASTTGQLLNGAAIAVDGTWQAMDPPALAVVNGDVKVPVAAGSALLLFAR